MTTKKKTTAKSQSLGEQTLYLDPEENVTAVRERLEHIPNRYIALVVPPQTSLRGNVAWKLLYKCARDLGKDVSIISSDPQVRAMARAVQFKVAPSLRSTA